MGAGTQQHQTEQSINSIKLRLIEKHRICGIEKQQPRTTWLFELYIFSFKTHSHNFKLIKFNWQDFQGSS